MSTTLPDPTDDPPSDPIVDPEALVDAVNPDGSELVNWLIAVVLIVVGITMAAMARRAVRRVLGRASADTAHAEVVVGRIVQGLIIVISLIYALGAIGVRISPLLGALGIGGIALALAVQPALLNLFSGMIIHVQRPLRVGEEIETGDVQGRVLDVTSRAVVIQTYSGETVYIPNAVVVDREIVNYVRLGRRRSTLVVGVAYGSDIAQAREVIRRAASGVPGVLATPGVNVFASEFADSSVNFEVDVWHQPGELALRRTRDQVIQAVHESLGEAGITIPFPQRTVWFGDGVGPRPTAGGEGR